MINHYFIYNSDHHEKKRCHSYKLLIAGLILLSSFMTAPVVLQAAQKTELNSEWYCRNRAGVAPSGGELTSEGIIAAEEWMPAVVPGTVLTTLLENGNVPDPFFGMNNEDIADIYDVGSDHYTYWFYTEFDLHEIQPPDQFYLHFRGVNYGCDVFLNGEKLNEKTHYGMFLRQRYRVTDVIREGKNRLAVLVLPPDPAGNPNGGQGGDGVIGRNVMHQYVAGWDWIQPVRDRNTGIWDKVFLEKAGPVNIKNPHVVTKVPGKRYPGAAQEPCLVSVSAELENASPRKVKGKVSGRIGGLMVLKDVTLAPFTKIKVAFQDFKIENPALWWPNGYGEQALYDLELSFAVKKDISDRESVRFGIREIRTAWNERTRSRQVYVNGQKVFIKGGNWIISDAMLRFSEQRYDAEIRMHRQMNLNCIRIWGGAITERPEFYDACDRYGILVMQDFWMSGDCNGRWLDPRKKEDQWTRRNYPDDHNLFLKSAGDQIRMIRNHPSLAFWCGGNEIAPPEDILTPLKDSLRVLDGTRWFTESSTWDSMSFNFIGGNGDGPYSIQPVARFFEEKSFPFNSEVGSVGMPDIEGLSRYIPEDALVLPGTYEPEEGDGNRRRSRIHPVWRYHKFSGYRDFISKYGEPENVGDYAFKAQLVNYNQYRALMEGFTAHMWDWYTGVIIWKTQNPWTAMRGQMYDYYLDPNGGLYGLRHGAAPLHIFYDPVQGQVLIANNTFKPFHDMMIQVSCLDMGGKEELIYQEIVSLNPTTTRRFGWIGRRLERLGNAEGVFLSMKLLDAGQELLDENFYWLPDSTGRYSGLQKLEKVSLSATAVMTDSGQIEVVLENPSKANPVSFFNRISVVDKDSGKRVLPVFYSDNYVSVLPGERKAIYIDNEKTTSPESFKIYINGWNTIPLEIKISN